MQIETYKPDKLNLNEFISFYNIDMILNNQIINTGGFEIYNHEEILTADIENIKQDLLTEIKEVLNDPEELPGTYLNDIIEGYYCQTMEAPELLAMDPDDIVEELDGAIYDYCLEHFHEQEIYQYFIVSEYDIDRYILKYLPNYTVFYNENLDLYLLGIGHYGMSWSFFFTEAPRPEHMKIKKYDEILKAAGE